MSFVLPSSAGGWVNGLLSNLLAEAIGVIITLFVVERWLHYRNAKRKREHLLPLLSLFTSECIDAKRAMLEAWALRIMPVPPNEKTKSYWDAVERKVYCTQVAALKDMIESSAYPAEKLARIVLDEGVGLHRYTGFVQPIFQEDSCLVTLFAEMTIATSALDLSLKNLNEFRNNAERRRRVLSLLLNARSVLVSLESIVSRGSKLQLLWGQSDLQRLKAWAAGHIPRVFPSRERSSGEVR